MDIEQKQAEHIEFFVKQASALKGSALTSVIVEATSHPSLFAFSEILSVPSVLEVSIPSYYYIYNCSDFIFIIIGYLFVESFGNSLSTFETLLEVDFPVTMEVPALGVVVILVLEGTENSVYLDLLRLFAHGTWSDYKSIAGRLPQLVSAQALKLKQLTVLTLADTSKVLPYDQLMQELDVTNVRELEDFLINECMYVGIVRGKLDQLKRCFEVQFAAGRDLRPGQLGNMLRTLTDWLTTSDNLLVSIQEKIKWADTMSESDRKHRKEVEERVDEVKKSLSLKVSTV
ncbi:hypothetical protein MTR67_004563 [Solanum verrucosum]|uniref:PCI domain-containing protein n=1 Tax=Solanum verrucosum TaxID=315347 RepID=A0AAF0PUS4_SOLVR|nr:hypothetical protein MTR67_004563 [Solanum verrucosum]